MGGTRGGTCAPPTRAPSAASASISVGRASAGGMTTSSLRTRVRWYVGIQSRPSCLPPRVIAGPLDARPSCLMASMADVNGSNQGRTKEADAPHYGRVR